MTAIKYMHHVPGRLRIRGHHFHCRGERARKAIAALQAMEGVELVRLSPNAGSLTVHYDPAVHDQAELLAVLEGTGCLHLAAGAQTPRAPGAAERGESVGGLFAKALVGALAQRTATSLIGALL
jgi:copper chaperone CopZ